MIGGHLHSLVESKKIFFAFHCHFLWLKVVERPLEKSLHNFVYVFKIFSFRAHFSKLLAALRLGNQTVLMLHILQLYCIGIPL